MVYVPLLFLAAYSTVPGVVIRSTNKLVSGQALLYTPMTRLLDVSIITYPENKSPGVDGDDETCKV